MIDNDEVISEGFRPLRKNKTSSTEPVPLPGKPLINRGLSFNAATGEKESSQGLWESSAWEKMGRARGRTMDRANSFVGQVSTGESLKEGSGVIAIVDPFSTGAHLAAEVCKRGYKCARVLSVWDSPIASLVQGGFGNVDYCATIQHNDQLKDQEYAINETVQALRDLPFPLIAVLPGAETGVELADQLSYRLGLRSNGIDKSLARRNKYIMGETVRAAGVRAVKQARCTNIQEMISFLETLRRPGNDELKCVVKPVQSAGTDDVFLCQSADEAITAFNKIYGTVNGIGLHNDCVLVQEFLVGKEYVIDKVSRDGVHKLVAVWEYDKRKVNGANFVYFGMRLKNPDSEMVKVMVAYADKVLDAVGIKHGPSHMEVMLNSYQDDAGNVIYDPCLVEVGARCHGGEGTWLPVTVECIGYNVVTITTDAYLDGDVFNSIEKDSFPMKKAGRDVDMVSRHGGIVRSLPGEEAIRKLPSFRCLSWDVKPGDYCHKTIDCFTRPGCVQLVADTEEEAERDLEAVHDLELYGLIDYAVICPKPPSVGAIVIVDPVSSGAHLAAQVLKWGYKLILIFSEKEATGGTLISKTTHMKPTLLIQHDNRNPNQDAAVQQTLDEIDQEGSPILAIIPGAETGVALAEQLATKFGTRVNHCQMSEARRNKFIMHEALQAAGVRSLKQNLCLSEDDVISFWCNNLGENGKAVIKPTLSAAADLICVADSENLALSAFHAIHGQINTMNKVNDGALFQEYVDGTEFIVDGVSRDGVYKVTAVWECDKRSTNGAHFVSFGWKLRDGADPDVQAILSYANKVIRTLQIYQGPSHMELKLKSNVEGCFDPVLIDVAACCNGGEGTWVTVANECIGYNQIDMTLNCYVRPDRFDTLPSYPILLANGAEVHLVSNTRGTVKDIPGLSQIRSLSSFRRCELMTQLGGTIKPTVDYFTSPGSVQLVNKNRQQLEEDYEHVRSLEHDGLFSLL